VQQLREDLGWGLEVQTLARRVVVEPGAGDQLGWADLVQVGLAGKVSAQAADGVLDAALLPG